MRHCSVLYVCVVFADRGMGLHVLIAISGAYAKKSAAPEIVLQAPAARLFCCMSCGYT